MSANPVLVEVYRGGRVESRHRAAVAVADADGKTLLRLGDVEAPIFPRSAIKAAQALPMVESGAADAFKFGQPELALAASSHNAEPAHTETVRAMLAAAGRDEADLECGAQWPGRVVDQGALHRAGLKPGALHNNCSGKHAGFVCFACHAGYEPKGYVRPEHPVQREIRNVLDDVFGVTLDPDDCGIDGCSIPTWAIPLDSLAAGMAKLGSGAKLGRHRAQAARRVVAASMAEPFMVAGTHRFCTEFMQAMAGRVDAKGGAEGVYCMAVPEQGVGIAVKCDDGAHRAAEAIAARLAVELLGLGDRPDMAGFLHHTITNWNRLDVGHVETTPPLHRQNWRG